MPSLPPPRVTEIYYNGAWHDISSSMRETSAVKISRGVPRLGARADPTTATATLDNRSGDYSPRNPNSALFGKVGRNTPWRFSVNAGGPYLALPTGTYALSTPDAAVLDITADIDVRMDIALTSWSSPQMLAARYATGGNLAWTLETDTAGRLVLRWSPTGLGADKRYAVSTVPIPATAGQRLRVRATLDVDNGSAGCTAQFWVAHGRGGMWVRLGTPVTAAGTTSLYNATAPLHIGDNVLTTTADGTSGLLRLQGSVYALQVYAGIGGALRVDVAPERQAAVGATAFTDGTGLPWTLSGTASLANRCVRMEGEVPAWPPSRDLSGADRTVQITPAGIMRRLDSGTRPLDSALRRFILGAAPVECWPLTDGEQATQAAALLGSPAAKFTGDVPPKWGKGSVASWLEPTLLTDEAGTGQILATLGTPTPSGAWSVDVVRGGVTTAEFPSIRDSGLGSDSSPRTVWNLLFLVGPAKVQLTRDVYTTDASSTSILADLALPALFENRPHHVRLATAPGVSSTTWTLYVDGAQVATGSASGVGRPLAQISYAWGLSNQLSLGYITAWGATAPAASAVYTALLGFPGETAAARALRLSAENGIPASVAGPSDTSTELGVQEPQTFLDTLTTIAEADLGLALERRDARALLYRPRATLYSQDPTLVLDFAHGEISAPFDPLPDDKLTENDVTVRRRGGGSATAVQTTGPLSVDAIGRYDVAPELSLARDAQTFQHAYWRLSVGTFDGLRYTKITVNLGNPRAYAKAADAMAVDIGDLIRLQNVPADQQPGDVDLIVTGYEEEVGATAWTITYTCVPGEPWTVGTVEDPTRGKADTAGCQLAAAATATATTLSVTTTAGPRWITGAPNQIADPGFEAGIGTWRCSRGTSIGVTSWERTIVRSGHGAVRLTRVHPTDTGTLNLLDDNGWVPCAAGQTWVGTAWVLSGGAAINNMRAAFIWRDAGGATTNVSGPGVDTRAGDGWVRVTVTGTAPAGMTGVRLLIEGRSAWTVGEWWIADDVRLARTDNLVGTDNGDEFPFDASVGGEVVRVHGCSGTGNSQTLYVDRSRNSIVKAQAAGEKLSLTYPMRAAL
ncbi:hypothetical protein ACWCXC_17015 [Streptomyces sp. NPDC001515]